MTFRQKLKIFLYAFVPAFVLFTVVGLLLVGCASTEGLEQGRACPTAREVMVRKGYLVHPEKGACQVKLYGPGEEAAAFCYVKRKATDALWVPRTVFGNHCGLE